MVRAFLLILAALAAAPATAAAGGDFLVIAHRGASGDIGSLARMVAAAGADGVFTDDPAPVLSALGR